MQDHNTQYDEGELPPDARVCNCVGCGRLLLGESSADLLKDLGKAERRRWPRVVAERQEGRPWCQGCVLTRKRLS